MVWFLDSTLPCAVGVVLFLGQTCNLNLVCPLHLLFFIPPPALRMLGMFSTLFVIHLPLPTYTKWNLLSSDMATIPLFSFCLLCMALVISPLIKSIVSRESRVISYFIFSKVFVLESVPSINHKRRPALGKKSPNCSLLSMKQVNLKHHLRNK